MAIEFIHVRRKDDHTVTTTIARSALRLWAEWEPIPTDATPERSETAQVTETADVTKDPSPAGDAPDPKTRQRRAAATDEGKEK